MNIIAIYDNHGKTIDRYVVVFDTKNHPPYYDCLCMSKNPTHPQGFSQWSSCKLGEHLETKIEFADLPIHIQNHVKERLK